MRDADINSAGALATISIISGEVDVVDTAIARSFRIAIALGPYCQKAKSRIRGGIA